MTKRHEAHKICRDYARNGTCMFGKDCKYKHKDLESKRYLQYRTKVCVKQQQFGGCPFGEHCRYRHEEPSRSRLRIFQQLANGIGC